MIDREGDGWRGPTEEGAGPAEGPRDPRGVLDSVLAVKAGNACTIHL